MDKAATLAARLVSACAVVSVMTVVSEAETTLCTPITSAPLTITLPGVYCFTQNVTSSSGNGNAITIAADDVTIDMNGHALEAVGSTDFGIRADGRTRIVVRNGTVRGFRWGVTLVGGGGHRIEDLCLHANSVAGLNIVEVNGAVMRNNQVLQTETNEPNASYGVYVKSGSGNTITDNDVLLSSPLLPSAYGVGIYVLDVVGATVEKNRVSVGWDSLRLGTTYGVVYGNPTDGLVVDNEVVGSDVGIWCYGGPGTAKVRDNLVSPAVDIPYVIDSCVDSGNNN